MWCGPTSHAEETMRWELLVFWLAIVVTAFGFVMMFVPA